MDWHRRYLHQAAWTRELRGYLFQRAGLSTAHRILEVGCGTGAILNELWPGLRDLWSTGRTVCGLDISRENLAESQAHAPGARLTRADAHELPYASQAFDVTCCHFVLLWLKDPHRALTEMRRVTRRRGSVLVLAEPDYTARRDEPVELEALGRLQTESLQRQGADVSIGSRIAGLCDSAGIRVVESGVLEVRAANTVSAEEQTVEWDVLQSDLAGLLPGSEIEKLKGLDAEARRLGRRVLYVPTAYVWGQV